MKIGLVAALILLTMLPSIYAEISVDGPDKEIYNIGDEIKVSGYVTLNQAFDGFLKIAMKCADLSYDLPFVSVMLSKNEKKDFGNDVKLPVINVPRPVKTGTCSIGFSLVSGPDVVATASSRDFKVSNKLKGNFEIDKSQLQMGDAFKVAGNIYRLDGAKVDGSVEFYFKKDGNRFLAGSASISDGILSYEYKALQIPEGNYKIDMAVSDASGNEMLFQDVLEFNVISKLSMTARASKTMLNPGDDFKVYGDVKSTLSQDMLEGNINIAMDSNEYIAKIKNNKFEYRIVLQKTVKSGKHMIKVNGRDKNGNIGYTETSIDIVPEQKELRLKLSKETLLPGEVLEITPMIYDQGNEMINEDINIEVYDPNNNLVFSDAAKSNAFSKFMLNSNSAPGAYSILLSSTKLKARANFQVARVVDLNISIENESVILMNIGNEEFDDFVKIAYEPGDLKLVKRISIESNKTGSIKLFRGVKNTGLYDISVNYGNKQNNFKNVMVTAKKSINFDIVHYALAAILILMLAYFAYLKLGRRKDFKIAEERERIMAKRDLTRLRNMKRGDSGSKGYRFSHKNLDKNQALDDFKKSYVDKVKDSEQRQGMFGFMDK